MSLHCPASVILFPSPLVDLWAREFGNFVGADHLRNAVKRIDSGVQFPRTVVRPPRFVHEARIPDFGHQRTNWPVIFLYSQTSCSPSRSTISSCNSPHDSKSVATA